MFWADMDMEPKTTTRRAANDEQGKGIFTVPNILCFIRLAGSVPLFFAALNNSPQLFLWLFVCLAATDWLDGKLAILLNQRSVFGARLDSFADAALYTVLFFGSFMLHWDVLNREIWWAIPAIGTYTASTLYGLVKFGRWPSYHTKMAKTSWLFVLIGAVCLLSNWSIWPLKLAMVAVAITNLEAILLTRLLPEWRSDISSILTVLGPKYFRSEKGRGNDRK